MNITISRLYVITTIALSLFFMFSGLQGESGLIKSFQVSAKLRTSQLKLEALTLEQEKLENLNRRLSSNSLDLELLDERARKKIGLMRRDEIIIR